MPATKMTGIISGSTAPRPARPISPSDARGICGTPRRRARYQISTIRNTAITAAGNNPAMNSVPIEIGATDARTSIAMLGGIVSDIAAEAASTAAPSSGLYPLFSSSLRITDPTATTSATLDPEMPETK